MLVNAPCAECSLSTECIWMHRVRMQVNAPSECSWMLRVQNAPCHMNAFECTHTECVWMHANALDRECVCMFQNAPCAECSLPFECMWMHLDRMQVDASSECSWMLRVQNAPCHMNDLELKEWTFYKDASECIECEEFVRMLLNVEWLNESFTTVNEHEWIWMLL